jgi:DNA mismatch repair protein MutS2
MVVSTRKTLLLSYILSELRFRVCLTRQPLDAIKSIEEKVEKIEEKIEAPVERRHQTVDHGPSTVYRPLSLGEKVMVASIGNEGIVTALSENEAEVQIGSLRVRAKLADLARNTDQQAAAAQPQIKTGQPVSMARTKSPGLELNLRGKLVEDGLEELDRYLEQAYSSGLLFVRIIHGKGTGRMRDAVRAALKESPYVNSFEEPKDSEGGAGVTVATMKSG